METSFYEALKTRQKAENFNRCIWRFSYIDPLVHIFIWKNTLRLETFIQYTYFLWIVYITCEGQWGTAEHDHVFHFEALRFLLLPPFSWKMKNRSLRAETSICVRFAQLETSQAAGDFSEGISNFIKSWHKTKNFNSKENYYLTFTAKNVRMFPERYKTIPSLLILIHTALSFPGSLHQNFTWNIDSQKTVEYGDRLFLGFILKDQ